MRTFSLVGLCAVASLLLGAISVASCGSDDSGPPAGSAGTAGTGGSGGAGGGAGTAGTGGIAGAAGTAGNAGSAGTAGSAGSAGAAGTAGNAGSAGAAGTGCGPDDAGPNETLPDTTDPMAGVFTLAQALEGLPDGPGPLRAIISTSKGDLTCELRPDKAENGVANFVGLARGRRPWKDPVSNAWVKRRFYDGLTFHRVIPQFVAQGGDPLGTGYGGPGYKFADEISDLNHIPGTLAYANAGPNTNGSQFYIAEVDLPSLNGSYTTFGRCQPVSVVAALTSVPTDANDKPLTPLVMTKVEITRCAP